jgi:hypothetical protein
MDAKSKGVKPVFDKPRSYPDDFSSNNALITTIQSWPKNSRHLRMPRQPCYETFNHHCYGSYFCISLKEATVAGSSGCAAPGSTT